MANNFEKIAHANIALGDLTDNLISVLKNAYDISETLTAARAENKLSTLRCSNISREINDLIKVIKSIKNY